MYSDEIYYRIKRFLKETNYLGDQIEINMLDERAYILIYKSLHFKWWNLGYELRTLKRKIIGVPIMTYKQKEILKIIGWIIIGGLSIYFLEEFLHYKANPELFKR